MTKKEEIQEYSDQVSLEIKDQFNKVLNPIEDFNLETFDPLIDYTQEYYALKRERKDPPEILPTMGLKPKEILQGQMVGMYESKQDLYLIFAHKINGLQNRISNLEKIIDDMKNNNNNV